MLKQLTPEQIELIKKAEDLPDNYIVRDPIAAPMLGVSVWTLRRTNPVPKIQLSERCSGRRLGDIRRKQRGELAAPAA